MADDRPAMARVGRRPAMATKRAIVGRESRRLLMGEQVCVYLGKLGDVWRRADRWRASTAESAGADGAPAIDIPNDSQHPLVSQGLLCARDAGNAFGRLFASAFDAPPQCTAVCSRLARTSGVRRVDKVAPRAVHCVGVVAVRRVSSSPCHPAFVQKLQRKNARNVDSLDLAEWSVWAVAIEGLPVRSPIEARCTH